MANPDEQVEMLISTCFSSSPPDYFITDSSSSAVASSCLTSSSSTVSPYSTTTSSFVPGSPQTSSSLSRGLFRVAIASTSRKIYLSPTSSVVNVSTTEVRIPWSPSANTGYIKTTSSVANVSTTKVIIPSFPSASTGHLPPTSSVFSLSTDLSIPCGSPQSFGLLSITPYSPNNNTYAHFNTWGDDLRIGGSSLAAAAFFHLDSYCHLIVDSSIQNGRVATQGENLRSIHLFFTPSKSVGPPNAEVAICGVHRGFLNCSCGTHSNFTTTDGTTGPEAGYVMLGVSSWIGPI